MFRFMLLLFLIVCSCSYASSFLAKSVSDGSQAQCEITGISHTQGATSPAELGVLCRYHTQNNRIFALTLGWSGPAPAPGAVSVNCNGSQNLQSSPLGTVINTTSPTAEQDVSALYSSGYLFNVGAGQVLCQISFNNSDLMKYPGLYIAGLFSNFKNQPDVWELPSYVVINYKTVPAETGSVFCYLITPPDTTDMGIIKPNSESKQVIINIGVSCSGAATSTKGTILGYSVRFSQFNCSTDCSLLGEYHSYFGCVADPGDDPQTGFTMSDVMWFNKGETVKTKTYITRWKIRDNSGNPRDITAKAYVDIYYY
ncbi:hypothetical protein [Escherichia sp. E13S3]|uniref:hypothetical protein n=1 Tax=Escherichia sp. E13S3 TaxID=2484854 RepID=UPI001029C434|nr:hypothetical protein [Escherichia sp. E13S3]